MTRPDSCSDKERNTYKYHLKQGKKVIYHGITHDLVRREAEHQERFPGSHIEQVGRKTIWSAALQWKHREGKRRYSSSTLGV